jgi:hypothetical protein
MQTFFAESVVQEDGKLTLDHLPFVHGQSLQIFISVRPRVSAERHLLRGTVLKYERPLEPVASGDWTAAR